MSQDELIKVLVALPERELVDVVTTALSLRTAVVSRPEWEEARLCLAELHRFHEGSNQAGPWELLLLVRSERAGDYVSSGPGPTQEGAHCGHTLAGYTKRAICPLCSEAVSLT